MSLNTEYLSTKQIRELGTHLYTARILSDFWGDIGSWDNINNAIANLKQAQAKVEAWSKQGYRINRRILDDLNDVRLIVYSSDKKDESLAYARNSAGIDTSSSSGLSAPAALFWLEYSVGCHWNAGIDFPQEEYREIIQGAALKGIPHYLNIVHGTKRHGDHGWAKKEMQKVRALRDAAIANQIELPADLEREFQETEYMLLRPWEKAQRHAKAIVGKLAYPLTKRVDDLIN